MAGLPCGSPAALLSIITLLLVDRHKKPVKCAETLSDGMGLDQSPFLQIILVDNGRRLGQLAPILK